MPPEVDGWATAATQQSDMKNTAIPPNERRVFISSFGMGEICVS